MEAEYALYIAGGLVSCLGFLLVLPNRIKGALEACLVHRAQEIWPPYARVGYYYEVRAIGFLPTYLFVRKIGERCELYGELWFFPPKGTKIKALLTAADGFPVIDMTVFAPGKPPSTATLRTLITHPWTYPVIPTSVKIPKYARYA